MKTERGIGEHFSVYSFFSSFFPPPKHVLPAPALILPLVRPLNTSRFFSSPTRRCSTLAHS